MKSGRINKKKHELYDLQINEDEAAVVRIIFDRYTNYGYGTQRISTWLNEHGYRTRKSKMWTSPTIRGIIRNLTYTGILRSGESRSDVIPELKIITIEQYERAQEIMNNRSENRTTQQTVPLNTKGKSLLSGNVYCGHCGSKLTLTTNGRKRKLVDGTVKTSKRIRYICYGKTRKQTDCNGQTGYTMHILDDIIDKIVHDIFTKMKGIPKEEVITVRYGEELEQRKSILSSLQNDYAKENENLNTLKSEVVKCIRGKSSFSQEMLSGLISESETECKRLLDLCNNAEKEVNDSQNVLKELSESYDELISWAELYDDADFEKKKMIVNCLIRRVDVYSDYKLKIDFNFDFKQFIDGIDCIA